MFLLQLIFICNFHPADATQANPQPFSVIQTGGKEVTLFLRGNEHFNYYADTLGYPVVEQANAATTSETLLSSIEAQPEYVYGILDDSGRLQPTPLKVGDVDPRLVPGLATGVAPSFKQGLLSAIAEKENDDWPSTGSDGQLAGGYNMYIYHSAQYR
jgi:hypothetical protein